MRRKGDIRVHRQEGRAYYRDLGGGVAAARIGLRIPWGGVGLGVEATRRD